ncbi:hypothetical protein [Sedimenticola sp.]|uniref:hypothetical protein n=1 Tax=Sedimenticola sp. TaxID=1940285 RepID=UPI003D0ED237
MSHTNIIYPQSTHRNIAWQVREDGDDYGKGSNNVQRVSLSDLHDRVIERLDRAKALTHLLKTAETQADDVTQHTLGAIEEHIEQAQTTSNRMWGYIQRERRGE